jgi:carboxyl-terminal processing protease
MRGATLQLVANPRRSNRSGQRVEPFSGPVAVLVDELTASTSEFFAAGMQSRGRARVFGSTSSGQALPAGLARLPSGDRLMFVIADFQTPSGMRLEGRGVIPDVLVNRTRAGLLTGRDEPLDAALAWLSTQTGDR